MHLVYLALGSNIERERNLPRAVALLARAGELRAVSRVHQTAPVGTTDQPDYFNAAVLLATTLSPATLKRDVIGDIERRLGRRRDPRDKNAPRTIDIDIALWCDAAGRPLPGDAAAGVPPPDPDLLRHAHLAAPLADISPGLEHPTDGRTLAAIAAELTAAAAAAGRPVRRRDDVVLRPATGPPEAGLRGAGE